MAEWHVSGYGQQRHPVQPQQPAAGGVEWYSGTGAAQYGASSTYNYDAPVGAQGGGAAYGSFEDEAPLLEGQ